MDPNPRPWPGRKGATALVLVAALAGPCGAAAAETPARDAAHAGAALGVDLYRSFAAQDGNLFFSPYSISEALAFLSAGADGNTRHEMLGVLHWTQPADRMAGAFAAQDLELERAAQDGVTVSVANGLWYQRGHEPSTPFLETARRDYRSEVRVADFSGNVSVPQREINDWVGAKTAGKIPDLFPAGSLTHRTRLVLANAIYFKGRWASPFKAQRTAPRPFYTATGQSITAPAMTRTAEFRTTGVDACELLELPYSGGLSMVILLPRTRDGLPALEQRLTEAALSHWLAALDLAGPQEMDVTLPRFKVDYSVELTTSLARLGMTTAFVAGKADFSPINGGGDLYVSTVLHKAFVDVNEEGTEAAAATGIAVASFAVRRSLRFTVDHPFLFLIRDASTGSLLFLGRIVDPRAK